MNEEYTEYTTFVTKNKDGQEIEMAVVDEFEFEKKTYVAAALITDDTIDADNLFIFKVAASEEFAVEKITNAIDYQRVAEAHMEMEAGEEE